MYNCHNEAVAYLKERLGTKEIHSGYNTKNSPSKVETVYLKDNIVLYSDEHAIHLLLVQQYHGIEAKKELYYKLIELGVKLN
jgi:hypothetical protein